MNTYEIDVVATMMQDDTCVCCGAYVPEGRHICSKCEDKSNISAENLDMLIWLSKASDKEVLKAMSHTEKELFGCTLS